MNVLLLLFAHWLVCEALGASAVGLRGKYIFEGG
jgi:hypothetical protein